MHIQTTHQSTMNEPPKDADQRMIAASGDSDEPSNNGSDPHEPSPPQDAENSHRVASLVGLLQHAYLRLLAGDSGDARHTLERALASEGFDAVPILSTPTVIKHNSKGGGAAGDAPPQTTSRSFGQQDTTPIVIKTLGTFEVLVEGQVPGAKRKPPHRLLALLKVLIANGGCAVNRSLLQDALWPDLDGDHANDAQQVALHRLRRLLCHHDALIINHGYVSLNPQFVEVDAFILDSLCRNPFLEGFQQRARAALDLYQGPFLPDELESAWSQRMRECMLAKFVNIISAAGKELESQNDFPGAAALYEQALSVGDLKNVIGDGLVRALKRGKVTARASPLAPAVTR